MNGVEGAPEISEAELQLLDVLGKGSFGTVYRARCRSVTVAVKVLERSLEPKTLAAFRGEVSILVNLRHPNLCLLLGCCYSPERLMLVSELVSRGDLEKMLHDQTVPLSLPRRLRMATDAVVGMCWLHSPTQSIIHRDLKSSNLLVDDHYRIKVCDFGLSQVLAAGEQARDERSAKGTPLWMAPEVMQFKPFDRKCDVYSFGIVLWEIVTREEPFKEFNNYNVFRDAVCRQHVRPPIPPNTLPALDQLMRTMWHHDPAARPEFLQVLEVLKGLVVDAAIRDPLCRQFWKAHFLTEDPAAWQNCCPLLLEFLQVSPAIIDVLRSNTAQAVAVMAQQSPELAAAQRNVACLRAVLADDATGGALTVGLEKFGRVMDVFAPIQQNQSVLDDIQLLLQEHWFHGAITTAEAENRLRPYPSGTFLVRYSSTELGSLTLSYVTPDARISHLRLRHELGEGFYLQRQVYPTLTTLIEDGGRMCGLSTPCPGSTFRHLFAANQNTAGGYEGYS